MILGKDLYYFGYCKDKPACSSCRDETDARGDGRVSLPPWTSVVHAEQNTCLPLPKNAAKNDRDVAEGPMPRPCSFDVFLENKENFPLKRQLQTEGRRIDSG